MLALRTNQLMVHLFYTESYYALIGAGRNTNSVTQTTNMNESNGTNLKPILPILFFFDKLMNIGMLFHNKSSSRVKGLKE
jgi:hypothetical protein